MWVAKLKMDGSNALIGSRTKKFRVSVEGYPLAFFETKKSIHVFVAGIILGEEKNKKAFLKDLEKAERVRCLDAKGDFILAKIDEPKKYAQFYNPEVIYLKGTQILEDGTNVFHLGSWQKEELMKFARFIQKNNKGKLISVKQEKVGDVSIASMHPELTAKQKVALRLAVKNGYYRCPREIGLEDLAQKMGISYSTFQVHLRKAEQKLIPFMFQRTQ